MNQFERLFFFMMKPWMILGFFGLMAVSLGVLDRPIAEYFYRVDTKDSLFILNGLTTLGISVLYLVIFLILALFFRYLYCNKTWELRMWFLWACVLIPNSIALVLKVILGRARPILWFNEHLYGFYGMKFHTAYWSCPSGHTTTAMSLAIALSMIWPRYIYGFLAVGLSVAVSRVMLAQHYFSDVVATSYLVVLELGLLLLWLRRKKSGFVEQLRVSG